MADKTTIDREAAVTTAAETATNTNESQASAANQDDTAASLEAQEDMAEACLNQQMGWLSCIFSMIPAPFLGIVKVIIRILLWPLRIIAVIPFRGLYLFLKNFCSK